MPRIVSLLSSPPCSSAGVLVAGTGAADAAYPLIRSGSRMSFVDDDEKLPVLAAVSHTEAWVSGTSLSGVARVFHTRDAGAGWQDVSPAGTDGLF